MVRLLHHIDPHAATVRNIGAMKINLVFIFLLLFSVLFWSIFGNFTNTVFQIKRFTSLSKCISNCWICWHIWGLLIIIINLCTKLGKSHNIILLVTFLAPLFLDAALMISHEQTYEKLQGRKKSWSLRIGALSDFVNR